MVLHRRDPFGELRQMQETMNRLWRGFGTAPESPEMETWGIPLDVVQQDDDFIVRASMPGVNPDDIKVAVEDNVLTIRARTGAELEHKESNYLMRERRTGNFYRALRLPDTVNTDQAHPFYEHGILTISIPKAEAKKAKHLTVNLGGKAWESGRGADGQWEAAAAGRRE